MVSERFFTSSLQNELFTVQDYNESDIARLYLQAIFSIAIQRSKLCAQLSFLPPGKYPTMW
jgi:hypothetical protein